jgi:hypothetical protein
MLGDTNDEIQATVEIAAKGKQGKSNSEINKLRQL